MKSARELLQELVDAHQAPPPSTTTSPAMHDIRLRAAWEAACAYLAAPDDRPPREPTKEMQKAGLAEMFDYERSDLKHRELLKIVRKGWRAMYDAYSASPTGVRDDAPPDEVAILRDERDMYRSRFSAMFHTLQEGHPGVTEINYLAKLRQMIAANASMCVKLAAAEATAPAAVEPAEALQPPLPILTSVAVPEGVAQVRDARGKLLGEIRNIESAEAKPRDGLELATDDAELVAKLEDIRPGFDGCVTGHLLAQRAATRIRELSQFRSPFVGRCLRCGTTWDGPGVLPTECPHCSFDIASFPDVLYAYWHGASDPSQQAADCRLASIIIREAAAALLRDTDDALATAVNALREIQRVTDAADTGAAREANEIAMCSIAAIAEQAKEPK